MDLDKLIATQRAQLGELLVQREDLDAQIDAARASLNHTVALLRSLLAAEKRAAALAALQDLPTLPLDKSKE